MGVHLARIRLELQHSRDQGYLLRRSSKTQLKSKHTLSAYRGGRRSFIFSLLLFRFYSYYFVWRFHDRVLRDGSSDGGEGVDAAIFADYRAGVEHAAAAYLGAIADHCAELSHTRGVALLGAHCHFPTVGAQV